MKLAFAAATAFDACPTNSASHAAPTLQIPQNIWPGRRWKSQLLPTPAQKQMGSVALSVPLADKAAAGASVP